MADDDSDQVHGEQCRVDGIRVRSPPWSLPLLAGVPAGAPCLRCGGVASTRPQSPLAFLQGRGLASAAN